MILSPYHPSLAPGQIDDCPYAEEGRRMTLPTTGDQRQGVAGALGLGRRQPNARDKDGAPEPQTNLHTQAGNQ